MKQLKWCLKMLIICMVLIGNSKMNAQMKSKDEGLFLRVYNLENRKIAKGKIIIISDSILKIENNGKLKEIKLSEIGKIKTKRSGGHNVLMGSALGASVGVILGVSTADPDAWVMSYTAGEGALVFGSLGAIGGAAVGGITAGFKNSETFVINGEKENWQILKRRFSNFVE